MTREIWNDPVKMQEWMDKERQKASGSKASAEPSPSARAEPE